MSSRSRRHSDDTHFQQNVNIIFLYHFFPLNVSLHHSSVVVFLWKLHCRSINTFEEMLPCILFLVRARVHACMAVTRPPFPLRSTSQALSVVSWQFDEEKVTDDQKNARFFWHFFLKLIYLNMKDSYLSCKMYFLVNFPFFLYSQLDHMSAFHVISPHIHSEILYHSFKEVNRAMPWFLFSLFVEKQNSHCHYVECCRWKPSSNLPQVHSDAESLSPRTTE